MKIDEIPSMIVTAVVVILVTASILVPIIDSANESTKVYYNNDFGVLSAVADNETIDYTIVATGNSSGAISECFIEGTKVATVYQGIRAIVIADSYIIAQQNSTSTWALYSGKSVESSSMFPLMSDEISITITSSASTISFVDGDGAQTVEIPTEWCYYRDDNSDDWRIVDYTSTSNKAYINDPSQIKGSFWSGVINDFIYFDGTEAVAYGTYAQTMAVTLDGYSEEMNGVYSFDVGGISGGQRTEGVSMTLDYDGTPIEINPYFIVIPNEVYGQTESDKAYIVLLNILPIIIMISVVVGVVRMAFKRT